MKGSSGIKRNQRLSEERKGPRVRRCGRAGLGGDLPAGAGLKGLPARPAGQDR